MYNGNNNGIDFAGFIADLYSVYLGQANLRLNTEQVNALDAHLQKQDNEYLAKMLNRLEYAIQQNEILIKQNNQLIELLNKR